MMIKSLFIPGDNWLYFKIYTGIKTADWILGDKLFPVIKKLIKYNLIEKFYFIRYSDPDFHIRLRLLLSGSTYLFKVIDIINNTLKPIVEKQLAWKIQIDTYKREIERYNPLLIESTESLFYADSVFIIKIIRYLEKFQDENYRWMISLLLIDKLLFDLNFNLEHKKNLMETLSNAFKTEFGFTHSNSKQFNNKYRSNKSTVECVLNNNIIDSNFNKLVGLSCQRSVMMRPFICNLKRIISQKNLNIQDYIGSYIHMTMNRLFRTDNRLHELIIYDFMKQYYTSQIFIKNHQEN